MKSRMLSLENISVVNSAIFISLSPEIKKEILCVEGSEYYTNKSKYLYYRKAQWVEIIKRKAKIILKGELSENLQNKVISILPAIAFRMLIWAHYHEGLLKLDCSYSFQFLKHSHFTLQGYIDDEKAAEDMIMDISLSIEQRYILACFYCFPKYISSFFKEIVKTKTMLFGRTHYWCMDKPEIVRQWTYEMTGEVDVFLRRENTPRYLRGLLRSIRSGSKEAVKHFWEETCLISRDYALFLGATEVLDRIGKHRDWIVFEDETFYNTESGPPTYCYVDILCFFLSNMTETQQKKALEDNIKGSGTQFSQYDPITVLELFLCWPYQDYFMKTAVVLWDLIPSDTYAIILLKICDKIEPRKTNLLYGEEKCYNYEKLLIDFWSQSPHHFKRYVFSDVPIVYRNGATVNTTTGIGLLHKLISLKKFTYDHEEIVWLILGSATVKERTHLTSAETWSSTCISILKKEKFKIFDRLLHVFCKSKEEDIIKFKEKLDLFKVAHSVCCHFLRYGKMSAVKSLIKSLSFPEHQLNTLKEGIIYSAEGKKRCWKILSSRGNIDFEEFIKWFFASKEREIIFKKYLASLIYHAFPAKFPSVGVPDFISSFTRSKLTNLQAIKKIQTGISETFGRSICEDLIAGSSSRIIYNEKDSSFQVKNEFRGGQWERVDKILSWSVPTTKKLYEFKESFFKQSGDVIHYNLIKRKKWGEAIRFFDWLDLPDKKIKILKENALFRGNCWWYLRYLVFDPNDDMDNLEEIDLLLRWHLIDKSTARKFRTYFLNHHEDWDEAGLKKFNMLIENCLDDLDDHYEDAEERFMKYLDGGGLKRKSSVFPQQKKLRLSSVEEEVLQNEKTVNSSRCIKEVI